MRLFINGWHAGMSGVGQGSYATRLIDGIDRHLQVEDGQVHLLAPREAAPEFERRLKRIHVNVVPFKRSGHPVLDNILWHHRLLGDRRLFEPDTVFFSPGPCWSRTSPPRLAITCHDVIYRHFPAYLGRKGVRKWLAGRQENFLRHAGVVFTQSEDARDDLLRQTRATPESIKVVPAWLPPSFARKPSADAVHEVRLRYRLPGRYWLYVGGYDIRKNLGFLISAYALAAKHADLPPLVLAGRLPRQKAASLCDVEGAIRASGLDERAVMLPGFIEDEDLPALYAGAELFVFPSLMEGYGLPPLEALGCGCPVLVADNSSLREVVPDQHYRFNTEDPACLAESLRAAAKHPLSFPAFFDREKHDEATAIRTYLSSLANLAA